jgi:hypothetical protein
VTTIHSFIHLLLLLLLLMVMVMVVVVYKRELGQMVRQGPGYIIIITITVKTAYLHF